MDKIIEILSSLGDVKGILGNLSYILSGGWQTSLIFGVVGLIVAPIVLPIMKKLIGNWISEFKQKAADEATKKSSQTDFENHIKSGYEQEQMAKENYKKSQEALAKALGELKKK